MAAVALTAEVFFPKLSTARCFWKNKNKIKRKIRVGYHQPKSCEQMEKITQNGIYSYRWCPGNIIDERFSVGRGHACMVLNRDIKIPSQVAKQVWENGTIRCTVDGGANRWRQFIESYDHDCKLKPPDFITGDFDSITKETMQYFKNPTIRWVHTPDQNETDFTKAIGVVRPVLEEKELNDIIVFHDVSGRFDQIMANINTLFKTESTILHVYLLSGNSLTWLLRPGKHSIKIPSDLVKNQRWCSLMPIGVPATNVTTFGLKWNLKNDALEFGSLVSTSNTYAEEQVQIETTTCLVWSMGIFSFDDD